MKPTTQSKKRSLLTLGAVAALGALCLNTTPVDAAVMAIDYGTDWFKVALVKPGIPFDIVLNAESKRKTQSAINIRGDNRAFGSEALSLVWIRAWFNDQHPCFLKLPLRMTHAHPDFLTLRCIAFIVSYRPLAFLKIRTLD